jgi:hypothetical protein
LITGATGYIWTLPSGAYITAGDNTNSIIVDFSTSALSGNITVTGANNCGNGISSPELEITVTPLVPTELALSDILIQNGQTQCYNALQTITLAGNGTGFLVQNGGSVTLIAGQNIRFLSGTTVLNGGYLHGYITTNGSYCGTQAPSMVNSLPDIIANATDPDQELPFFKVYPNPTTGKFILELTKERNISTIVVQIYSMFGEMILKEEKTGIGKYEFMIGDRPPGIYVINVTSGGQTGTAKIIKR